MRILLVFVIILLSTGCGSSSIKLNINSEKVQSLYNMAIEDATILKNLYENPNTFENQYILSISINNYLNEQNEVIKSISKNIVEEYVYKIFGDNNYRSFQLINTLFIGLFIVSNDMIIRNSNIKYKEDAAI